jgi:hypothetical protein
VEVAGGLVPLSAEQASIKFLLSVLGAVLWMLASSQIFPNVSIKRRPQQDLSFLSAE